MAEGSRQEVLGHGKVVVRDNIILLKWEKYERVLTFILFIPMLTTKVQQSILMLSSSMTVRN